MTDGEHRIPVGKQKSVTLELNAETLAIKEREEPRECPPARKSPEIDRSVGNAMSCEKCPNAIAFSQLI